MVGPVAIESWLTIGGFSLWRLYRSWINSLLCKSENLIFLSSRMWYINLLLKAINTFKLWKIEKSTVHNILQSLLFTYHVELRQVDRLVFPLLDRESESRSVVPNCLPPRGLYSPWNSPGQNTGVRSCSFPQGIFPTQGSNPGLPHCRQIFTSWATSVKKVTVLVAQSCLTPRSHGL